MLLPQSCSLAVWGLNVRKSSGHPAVGLREGVERLCRFSSMEKKAPGTLSAHWDYNARGRLQQDDHKERARMDTAEQRVDFVKGVEIARREVVLNGQSFGSVGPYEKIVGTIRFAADPEHAANRNVTDI